MGNRIRCRLLAAILHTIIGGALMPGNRLGVFWRDWTNSEYK